MQQALQCNSAHASWRHTHRRPLHRATTPRPTRGHGRSRKMRAQRAPHIRRYLWLQRTGTAAKSVLQVQLKAYRYSYKTPFESAFFLMFHVYNPVNPALQPSIVVHNGRRDGTRHPSSVLLSIHLTVSGALRHAANIDRPHRRRPRASAASRVLRGFSMTG